MIDWDALRARHASRPGLLEKLAAIALETHLDKAAEMRAAAAAADLPRLRLHAHGVKGVAANMCAAALVDCAHGVEVAAHAGRADAVAQAETLARAIEDFLEDIRRHIA